LISGWAALWYAICYEVLNDKCQTRMRASLRIAYSLCFTAACLALMAAYPLLHVRW